MESGILPGESRFLCFMRDGGKGGRKGKGTKEMCVQGLPRGILAAKGVNVRCEESPLVG